MEQQGTPGITRRQFAQAAGAAGTFAILSSRGAAAQANGDTLKVGLLGCGGRGTGAAMNILEGENNVQLVALADLFEDRVKGAREKLQGNTNPKIAAQVAITDEMCFTGFDAYEKILATDIDILIEASLPYCRPKHIAAAVEAKKHIFTEKPVAVDPAGIRTFLDAVKKHKEMGLTLVAGTQRRHHPAYQQTIEKIHQGEIGDVIAMRAYWCGGLPFVHDRKEGQSDFEYRMRNWYGYCWVAGDNIVEQHVHNLDIVNWVMGGPPTEVYASGGRVWKPKTEKYGDIFDQFSCDYTYAGDKHVLSMSRHWDGTDGGVFEQAFGTKKFSDCTDLSDSQTPMGHAYVLEHQNLCNSIRKTGAHWHEGEQVAHSTLTAIMGRMSAYTGKRITWEEAMTSDLDIVPKVWSFDEAYPVGDIPNPVKKA